MAARCRCSSFNNGTRTWSMRYEDDNAKIYFIFTCLDFFSSCSVFVTLCSFLSYDFAPYVMPYFRDLEVFNKTK